MTQKNLHSKKLVAKRYNSVSAEAERRGRVDPSDKFSAPNKGELDAVFISKSEGGTALDTVEEDISLSINISSSPSLA